jgi:hypothetical protein
MADNIVSITTTASTNEIDSTGKVLAGIIFILTIVLSILGLIAFWPDKLPKTDTCAIYQYKLFSICLIDSTNSCEKCDQQMHLSSKDSSLVIKTTQALLKTDSNVKILGPIDSTRISDSLFHLRESKNPTKYVCGDTIKLHSILLILVAISGFLGSLIHIASSFTNFVGAEKFKKSWYLWYFVKPFTGSALALILYFVFRAGLLNFNDVSNINIYGVITLAALAGLFTDKATLKLEEVFSVIFKPADTRPNKLNEEELKIKIAGIAPDNLSVDIENELTLAGENLNKRKLVIKIDGEQIENANVETDKISFKYKIPSNSNKTSFTLAVFDEQGKEIYSTTLTKNSTSTVTNKDENKSEMTGQSDLNQPPSVDKNSDDNNSSKSE